MALANRNKALWCSSDNRINPGQMLVSSEFTTAPVVLHSGAAFSRQGECPMNFCKRKPAHGTHMPAVRMMPSETGASFPGLESQLPHQG